MATFDPTQFPELREVFPELTPVQFETAMLFALGVSQQEIALLRTVSYKVVKQTLADAKTKFEPYSLNSLFTVFHVRLVLFALQKCKQRE
ncbi:transcriptional regulator (plasmid) [Candidatus Fukatsuia symbiotica]|uniref:Transcriptional regulator n=1 Tax=Candidatus Fukatsuia symbiotica TaxID=1878942 RepID=A0A2U8I8N6_9GAMM|nr:transcriptional regulator [Candidatus Fukatsuia symbiotica]AWK15556.1 transcriptional regulator [Candidatus Fukatsuia symbiotica]MEA9445820.1 transcriptional regulator [Candidatus Fukatsuia symbiotica]